MKFTSPSRYALFMLAAVVDALSAVVITVAGGVSNLALFLGVMNLSAGFLSLAWLFFCSKTVFTRSALSSIWSQHRRGPHKKILRRRFTLALLGRLDWIFFALAIAVGSPLVAVIIISGGWPIAHALKLRRIVAADGERDRYHKMGWAWVLAVACSLLGLILCLFVTLDHGGDITAWRWLAGFLLALVTLYVAHWNTYGMRWAAHMRFPSEQSDLQSDYRMAVLVAGIGSIVSGAIAVVAGVFGSWDPQHLIAALAAGVLIGLGAVLYRVGLGTTTKLNGLVAFYFTPVLSTLMLLALGLDSVDSLGLFGLGMVLLVGGNIWINLSGRKDVVPGGPK